MSGDQRGRRTPVAWVLVFTFIFSVMSLGLLQAETPMQVSEEQVYNEIGQVPAVPAGYTRIVFSAIDELWFSEGTYYVMDYPETATWGDVARDWTRLKEDLWRYPGVKAEINELESSPLNGFNLSNPIKSQVFELGYKDIQPIEYDAGGVPKMADRYTDFKGLTYAPLGTAPEAVFRSVGNVYPAYDLATKSWAQGGQLGNVFFNLRSGSYDFNKLGLNDFYLSVVFPDASVKDPASKAPVLGENDPNGVHARVEVRASDDKVFNGGVLTSANPMPITKVNLLTKYKRYSLAGGPSTPTQAPEGNYSSSQSINSVHPTQSSGLVKTYYSPSQTPRVIPTGYKRISFEPHAYLYMKYNGVICTEMVTYDVSETLTWQEAKNYGLVVPEVQAMEGFAFRGWNLTLPWDTDRVRDGYFRPVVEQLVQPTVQATPNVEASVPSSGGFTVQGGQGANEVQIVDGQGNTVRFEEIPNQVIIQSPDGGQIRIQQIPAAQAQEAVSQDGGQVIYQEIAPAGRDNYYPYADDDDMTTEDYLIGLADASEDEEEAPSGGITRRDATPEELEALGIEVDEDGKAIASDTRSTRSARSSNSILGALMGSQDPAKALGSLVSNTQSTGASTGSNPASSEDTDAENSEVSDSEEESALSQVMPQDVESEDDEAFEPDASDDASSALVPLDEVDQEETPPTQALTISDDGLGTLVDTRQPEEEGVPWLVSKLEDIKTQGHTVSLTPGAGAYHLGLTTQVRYAYLDPEGDYALTVKLMELKDGEAIQLEDIDGNALLYTDDFKPDADGGIETLDFEFTLAQDRLPTSILSYVEVLDKATQQFVVMAKDHDEIFQKVNLLGLDAELVPAEAGGSQTLEIAYYNATPGETYEVSGQLHKRGVEDDAPLGAYHDSQGQFVEFGDKFTADGEEGTWALTFAADTSLVEKGQALYAKFDAYQGGNLVGTGDSLVQASQASATGEPVVQSDVSLWTSVDRHIVGAAAVVGVSAMVLGLIIWYRRREVIASND